jgi:hypothetical protein
MWLYRPDATQCSTSYGIFFQNTFFGDQFNRLDDVDSCLDALIHMASIAFKIQTSRRQSSWSRRACIRYENCVRQINRPDDHSIDLDARSLDIEITCSRSAIVWTTGHHRLDATQIRKEFQQNFRKADHKIVRLDAL